MIRSRLLEECHGLLHAFTDRDGGLSREPFASLNLAFHVGDAAEDVLANHAIVADTLGYERQRLVHMRQVHSDRITRATPDMTFDTPPECDALMTDTPGQPLMVMVADCTPLLLYDPVRRGVAAVHAGRAGALKNIAGKTVEAMTEAFGSDPAELLAVLGPSIGGCCYEVNADIADTVTHAGYPRSLRYEASRIFLDVNAILLRQLEAAGISPKHIEATGPCTACSGRPLFSYRAQRQKTGRQAGIIMLK